MRSCCCIQRICFFFSAIPLVGLLPGILYYRLTLIAGFRNYMPTSDRLLRRWLLRLLKLVLVLVQWIPLVGALTLPLVCLVDFLLARRSITELGEELWSTDRALAAKQEESTAPAQ